MFSGTGLIVITTCRAVKTNQAAAQSSTRDTPKRMPENHFTMVNGLNPLEGRPDRNGIGSIFIGSVCLGASLLSWILSFNSGLVNLVSAYNGYAQ